MNKYKIVVTDDRYGTYDIEKEVLKDIYIEFVIADCKTPDQVISTCNDADGILCNLAPMPKEVIEKLEKCKIISRYGVGFDNIDVDACTKSQIQVSNVTDYCMEEVSDQALALIMSCTRKTARRDAQVRAGMWNIGSSDLIYRIAGKTFSLLGFGMIAKCLLRKIKGLNFSRILVYDPFVDKKTIEEYGCIKVDFETALKESDIISIHMPLNEKTKGIINKEAFGYMRSNAILVNTSRGGVIDEEALYDALETGKINSAGLDVHCSEPMDINDPLLKIPNCVLTDHVGWYSEESIIELKRKAAENVKDALLGFPPKYPVNKI